MDGGLRPIYEGRLPKTDWYQLAVSYGAAPTFALNDEESYRRRRRIVAKPYTNSNIRSNDAWQAQQLLLADELRVCLENLFAVDLSDIFFAWSLAVISTFVFGPNNGTDLLHNLSEAHELQEAYTKERLAGLWLTSWPKVCQSVLRGVGYSTEISCIAHMRQHADIDGNEAFQELETAYRFIKSGMRRETPDQDQENASAAGNRHNALSSEVQDHIVAGLDTSQITLTICVWLLSLENNRFWQARLRVETSKTGSTSKLARWRVYQSSTPS